MSVAPISVFLLLASLRLGFECQLTDVELGYLASTDFYVYPSGVTNVYKGLVAFARDHVFQQVL